MLCPECGTENREVRTSCASCGAALTVSASSEHGKVDGIARLNRTRYKLLACLTLLLIVAAIATPNLLTDRPRPKEASAVGSVRAINTACGTYISSYPKRGYPPSLKALGPPRDASPSPEAADLIDPILAAGAKSGYRFTYEAFDRDGDGVVEAYRVNAAPIDRDEYTRHHFFSDQSGIIRFELDQPATVKSQPLQ